MIFDISYAINGHFCTWIERFLIWCLVAGNSVWNKFWILINLVLLASKTSNPIRQSDEFQRIRNLLVRCLKEKIVNVYQFLLYWVSRKQATQFISQWLVVSYFSHLNVLLPYSKYCLNIFTVLQYYLFLVRYAAKDRFKILYNYHEIIKYLIFDLLLQTLGY